MKKVLFWMLFLMILGAASVKAQVRIGGNTAPNAAAALDLNAAEGTTGTKGLALPRVTLSSNTATLDGTTANINGMLVYNTGGSLSTGVYYWNGANWNRVDDGFLGGDTIVGNEVTDATTAGGLLRAGSGSRLAPYTLGIAPGGVTLQMLATPPNPLSILMYADGAWRYARYAQAATASYDVSTGSNYLPSPSACRTLPNLTVTGSTGLTDWRLYWDGTNWNFLVVSGSGQATIAFWCWITY